MSLYTIRRPVGGPACPVRYPRPAAGHRKPADFLGGNRVRGVFTATVAVAVEDFALAHALREVPEMEVKADRLAAHSRHWVMPCLWGAGGDFDAFDAALAADPTVEEVVTATEYDEEKFYQVNWTEDLKLHLDAALDREGSVLHAETRDGDWHLTIRFTTRDQFETFRRHLSERGISFHLENLTRATSPQQFMGGLTAAQRDALVAAVEEGYFAIPREATMADVADALGISTQSASERLRRGVEQFVETMLLVDEDPAGERSDT